MKKKITIITDMLHEKDYQLWLERVSEDGKVGIYIEEGEIKSVDSVPVVNNGNGIPTAAVAAIQEPDQQPANIFE